MRYLPLLGTLMLLLPDAMPAAMPAEKGQSIMFGDPDPIATQQGTNTAEQGKTDLCKQLRQDMDALKGKPQQRNAVVQRYRLECRPPDGL